MTPLLSALINDDIADREVLSAQRSMDTKRISTAIERRYATTHALMAIQLREARSVADTPTQVAAE